MDYLCLVIELFVGEEAWIYAALIGPTYFAVGWLFYIFLADADLDGAADPFILLGGLDIDEKEPFASFHLLHLLIRYHEHVFPCEKCGLIQRLLVTFIQL